MVVWKKKKKKNLKCSSTNWLANLQVVFCQLSITCRPPSPLSSILTSRPTCINQFCITNNSFPWHHFLYLYYTIVIQETLILLPITLPHHHYQHQQYQCNHRHIQQIAIASASKRNFFWTAVFRAIFFIATTVQTTLNLFSFISLIFTFRIRSRTKIILFKTFFEVVNWIHV